MPPKKQTRPEKLKELIQQEVQRVVNKHTFRGQGIRQIGAKLLRDQGLTGTFPVREPVDQGAPKRVGGPHVIGQAPIDFDEFYERYDARGPDAPYWFVCARLEELPLEPAGLDCEKVPVIVIFESVKFHPPTFMVMRKHFPDADKEDNPPERIETLVAKGFEWCAVPTRDGTPSKTFVLQKKEAPMPAAVANMFACAASRATSAQPAKFVFAASTVGNVSSAPAPAPALALAPVPALVPAPVVPAPAPAAVPSAASAQAAKFGFGASTVGNVSSALAPTPIAGFGKSHGNVEKAAPTNEEVKLEDVQIALWTVPRLKAMEKENKAGSRIVVEDVDLPEPAGRKVKLQLQNDVNDNVAVEVEKIIRKEFARKNAVVKNFDEWNDKCPLHDPELVDALREVRAELIAQQLKSKRRKDREFDSKLRRKLEETFNPRVAKRKKERADEVLAINGILQQLDAGTLAPKHKYRVLKFYPKNDQVKFRPSAKVAGVHEKGEVAHECVPPAYVDNNGAAFAAAAAASQASMASGTPAAPTLATTPKFGAMKAADGETGAKKAAAKKAAAKKPAAKKAAAKKARGKKTAGKK